MSKLIPLSQLPSIDSAEDLVDYLIDQEAIGIINDLTPPPNVEYELDDLLIVWHRLKAKCGPK